MQQTPTKLTLDRFARIIGINPLHFWGVDITQLSRTGGQGPACSQAIFQYDWQDADRVGREDVARAIAEAENDIETLVGYRLLPTWERDEWRPTTRPYRHEMTNYSNTDIRGLAQLVEAKWGYMVSGGVRATTLLDADAAVTYANSGIPPAAYLNIGTVTLTLAEAIDDREVAVFYPGHAAEERWRIRPVKVSHVGLDYTIEIRRELLLVEDYLETYDLANLGAANGVEDPPFLTTVDVYRVYNDPSTQVSFLWEDGNACCGCVDGTCTICAYGTATGCFLMRGDPRLSMLAIHLADWDADTLAFGASSVCPRRQPDLVRLWYQAGWRDQSQASPMDDMDDRWARIVAHLAASKLDRPICACSTMYMKRWQSDLAFSSGADETGTYSLTQSDLGNPLGTTRGAIEAWRAVTRPGAAIAGAAIDGR